MLLPRTRLPTFFLAAIAVLTACGGDSSGIAPELAAELGRSDARAAALAETAEAATTAREVERGDAIMLGYLERHRLGLGSPWRLIDYALHDDRLADSTRHQVAWSILARTISREADERYVGALDYLAVGSASSHAGSGRVHADLIDSVIESAADPRTGELTLRLAYSIAAAEHTTSRHAVVVGTHAAALARDRALARRDALALLRAAEAAGVDPVWLVSAWRAERRFLAEQPVLGGVSAEPELAATREVPRVLAAIRAIAANHAAAVTQKGAPAAAVAERAESMLGPAAAARLAELAATHGAPPQAPVLLAMRGYRSRLLAGPDDDARVARRARFIARVSNEESLAAEYALLSADGAASTAAELAVLAAAVSLKPYAQEPVWFPGMPGATVVELKARYGLASVSFDSDVPAEWRPFYLHTLARGIDDLQRVLPALSLDGAGVHFGESVMRDAALAMHDPATRTIYLPISSGAGTLAHEVLHDLDWQFARTKFGRQGGYGTDRAVREQSGPTVSSLRGLTAATLVPPMPQNGFSPPHAQRPAEVFARNADWFVAAALAREGRMNGYLSAVQDELLPGYVAAEPPGPTGAAGSALVDLLEDMTVLPEPARDWFLARFGRGRQPRAIDLVRGVLTAPLWLESEGRVHLHPLDPRRALAPRKACATWADNSSPRARAALESLVELAADARARTIVTAAMVVGGAPLAGATPPWSNLQFESEVARIRALLLSRLDAETAGRQPFEALEGPVARDCAAD